jgi:DNA-binding transcriptional ArsR family regulator
MRPEDLAAALSSSRRLRILAWLKDPEAHFPPQVEGDLVKDGVCGLFLARKLRITQASASEHLRILVDLRLVRSKRIKQWIFYRRDERRIAEAKRVLQGSL